MNNMSSSSYDLEEDEPETVEETLDRLAKKLNILNGDRLRDSLNSLLGVIY